MATVLRPASPFASRDADIPLGGALKRCFDVIFALAVLVTVAPLMLALGALVKLTSRGPAIYVHPRVGHGGKTFSCLKFRTMYADSDARLSDLLRHDPEAAGRYAQTRKLKHDPRVIPGIGCFLRKTSLDELPQFINVLRGDMSVIGPRPVTRDELDTHYGSRSAEVLRARPGISGLWQVSGRSSLTYETRVRLDMDYVRGWRFTWDMAILLHTVGVVLWRKGAY